MDWDILCELSMEMLWLQSLKQEGSCLLSLRVIRGFCLFAWGKPEQILPSVILSGGEVCCWSVAFTFSEASLSTLQSTTDVTCPDRHSRSHVIGHGEDSAHPKQ